MEQQSGWRESAAGEQQLGAAGEELWGELSGGLAQAGGPAECQEGLSRGPYDWGEEASW